MDGAARPIGITRVHMEEDAGKSVHDRFAGWIPAIDLNRAGTPLIEIVSEPDIRSARDAGAYVRALKQILEYTDVSDANMDLLHGIVKTDRLVVFGGGVPLVADGRTVGAIGVSGGSSEQDVRVAEAGAAAVG